MPRIANVPSRVSAQFVEDCPAMPIATARPAAPVRPAAVGCLVFAKQGWDATSRRTARHRAPVRAAIALLVAIAFSPIAAAQTIRYVDDDAAPNGNGLSWETAYDTLPPALTAAQPGDQIWVAAGTYVGNFTLALGVEMYGGFAGTETQLDQRDWTVNETVLDGNQTGSVVTGPFGATETTRIDGFTITNGTGTRSGQYTYGGGIYLDDSSPLVMGNRIYGNTAAHGGGGIYVYHGSPTIANNTITGNSDGVRVDGNSNATVASNTIAANGGGLIVTHSSSTITNNTLLNNGGTALLLDYSSATVANTLIAFNARGVSLFIGTPAFRHNCVFGNAEYDFSGLSNPTGTDGNISVDPRLADPSFGNTHVQPDSPCVDAGNNADAWGVHDVEGDPRILPAGGAVDIGADESSGTEWLEGPYVIVRVSPSGDDNSDGSSWALAKRTVQAGIDAASKLGGEVWVQAGRFGGRIKLRPYVRLYGGFAGAETSREERDWIDNKTILDGQWQGTVVISISGHWTSEVNGFTITNGNGSCGGAVLVSSGSVTIANNTITSNTSSSGGGICLMYSWTKVTNSAIVGNSADNHGGGLYLSHAAPTIANCMIKGNGSDVGGGLYLRQSSAGMIINNSIAGNNARFDGGAIYLYDGSPTISNTIVAQNSSGVYRRVGSPTMRYNCIFGNTEYDFSGLDDPTGTDGNISVDPRLADPLFGNMHIQADSPCVDVGNDADAPGTFDTDGDPRVLPIGGRVDIGADESDGTVWPEGPYAIVRVSPSGSDASDGSSWVLAKRTVQSGIDAAAQLGGEVWVQAGTYLERITLQAYAHLYGGFAGGEILRDERDFIANVTTLDAQQQGTVVTVQTGNGDATIDGFTITGGNADYGGGLRQERSTSTIANNTIRGNTAAGDGGGLYVFASSPAILNTVVSGNSAANGGGMWLRKFSSVIVGCTLTGNYASNRGGGLFLYESPGIVANCVVHGNTAGPYGGGLYVYLLAPTCVNNTITGNSADHGGAVFLQQSSAVFAGTIFAFNSSGLYRQDTLGLPVLNHNCLWGNVAYDYHGTWYPDSGTISAPPLFVRDPGPGPDGVWGTDDDDYGDLHLSLDSPVIDAGSNAEVPVDVLDLDGDGNVTEPLPFDLDGFERFTDDPLTPDTGAGAAPIVDIGAYEFGPDDCRHGGGLDHDGDVDLLNYAALTRCVAGPEAEPSAGCACFDLDDTGYVDLADVAVFQTVFTQQ